MSPRNGTAPPAEPPALEITGTEPAATNARVDRSREIETTAGRELDDAVRRVAERARSRRPGHDPSIRIRRVDPASLTPNPAEDGCCANCGLAFQPGDGHRLDSAHGSPVHANGGCERARRRAAARSGEAAPGSDAIPMNLPAASEPASNAEDGHVRARRDQALVEWLEAEGPKTASEIGSHLGLKQPQDVITRLRAIGLIEKTGIKRLAAGARSGRPGAEYRIVGRTRAHACVPEPATNGAAATTGGCSDTTDADAPTRRDGAAARHAEAEPERVDAADEMAPPGAVTVHEQLVVRYISALIGSIERAAILCHDAPPGHVYDRIERLLEIQDGAA